MEQIENLKRKLNKVEDQVGTKPETVLVEALVIIAEQLAKFIEMAEKHQ